MGRVTRKITCKKVEIEMKRVKTNAGGTELQGMMQINRDTIRDGGVQHNIMRRVRLERKCGT